MLYFISRSNAFLEIALAHINQSGKVRIYVHWKVEFLSPLLKISNHCSLDYKSRRVFLRSALAVRLFSLFIHELSEKGNVRQFFVPRFTSLRPQTDKWIEFLILNLQPCFSITFIAERLTFVVFGRSEYSRLQLKQDFDDIKRLSSHFDGRQDVLTTHEVR